MKYLKRFVDGAYVVKDEDGRLIASCNGRWNANIVCAALNKEPYASAVDNEYTVTDKTGMLVAKCENKAMADAVCAALNASTTEPTPKPAPAPLSDAEVLQRVKSALELCNKITGSQPKESELRIIL